VWLSTWLFNDARQLVDVAKVLRVPIDVRRALDIKVFEVRDDDSVTEHFV
jgi:hypothetical protein